MSDLFTILQQGCAKPRKSGVVSNDLAVYDSPSTGRATCLKLPTMRGENVKTVFGFLEGAAVFAISRTWADLISGVVLKLYPVAYCGGYIAADCTPPADALVLFLYAFCMIPVTGFCKFLVEHYELTKRPGMWDDIPMILNYIVGWAWGNAMLKWLQETTTNDDGLAMITSDGKRNFFFFNFFFTLLVSLFSGFIIVFIQPFTKEVECGDTRFINLIEDVIESTWSMVSRACSVSVMVLWYYTISSVVFIYVPPGDMLSEEVQLMYAVMASALGARVSVCLEKQEQRLKSEPNISATKLQALVGYSDLTQNVIGFVVGCAWSDLVTILFKSLSAEPAPHIVVMNIFIACMASGAVVFYLSSAKAKYSLDDYGNREETEQYFIINSMAFFIGWIWLVVTRNIYAQCCILFEHAVVFFDSYTGSSLSLGFGDLLAGALFRRSLSLTPQCKFLCLLNSVCLLLCPCSPLLTIFLFWLSGTIMTRMEDHLGVAHPESKGKQEKMLTQNWKRIKH